MTEEQANKMIEILNSIAIELAELNGTVGGIHSNIMLKMD